MPITADSYSVQIALKST